MPPADDAGLRRQLRAVGLSPAAIDAAWPSWWSDAANASDSAKTELAFTLARRLGLDPRSLVGGGGPLFLWHGTGRFKHLTAETDLERDSLASFGRAVAGLLAAAMPGPGEPALPSAAAIRESVLELGPHVGLPQLLAQCWARGVPVVHVRVYPLAQKRMAAMAVLGGTRPAILLARDAAYPAPVAFYLAHELGHIALGHVAGSGAIVDLDPEDVAEGGVDAEEREADRFAIELLAGSADLEIAAENGVRPAAGELAQRLSALAPLLRAEPGVLAEIYGHTTGQWDVAAAALRRLYGRRADVWRFVNAYALRQIAVDQLPEDAREFLGAVLGLPT